MASTERTGKPQFSLPAFDTHGGPTAVTTESFSPQSQAWLDHGFAFLSIN
jgi:dipeptidyl aminopeptidase/acylaminoacyl peptidase